MRARQASGERPPIEAFYRTLVEAAPEALLVIDSATLHFIVANRAAEHLLGYSRVELLERDLRELTPGPYVPTLEAALHALAVDGQWRGEIGFCPKDGAVVVTEATATAVRAGRRIIYEFVLRDSTERKRVEDAQQRRETRFRALIERGTDVVQLSGPDGTVYYMISSI